MTRVLTIHFLSISLITPGVSGRYRIVNKIRPLVSEQNITLEVITRLEDFDNLQLEWDRLFDQCDLSVFQSFEWNRTWWKYFGEEYASASLHIVVLRKGKELVGVAPLFIEIVPSHPLLGFRRLVFVAREVSDYHNFLLQPGKEDACIIRLAGHLAENSHLFDVVHFEEFSDRYSTHASLHKELEIHGFGGQLFISEYCPRTTLLESCDESLAAFAIGHRREVKRRGRNIEKNFAVEFEVVVSEGDAESGMDKFIEMHQEKWIKDGHTGAFADDRVARFHKEVASQFARRQWLYLTFLKLNGKIAATLYSFVYGDTLSIYLTGNVDTPDVRKYSPGRVLTAMCMEQAILQNKKVCDFMRGTEHYKYEMDAKDIPNWSILMYSPRSFLPKQKYKIDLLVRSLKRRILRERLLFGVVSQESGVFSQAMVNHLISRTKTNLKEGMQKAKAPERSVFVKPKST